MTKGYKILLIVYLVIYMGVCIYGGLVPSGINTYEHGSYFFTPKNDMTYSNSFVIPGCVYAKNNYERAYLVFDDGAEETLFEIQREQIMHEGKLVNQLSTYKQKVEMPNGEYQMYVRLYAGGETFEYPSIDVTVDENFKQRDFALFKTEHILTLLVLMLLMTAGLLIGRKSKKVQKISNLITVLGIMFFDIYIRVWIIMRGNFRATYDMFFHMCSLGAVLVIIMLLIKHSKTRVFIYNLMFIWGLGGALIAMVTPELSGYNFPSFYYIQFFLKHGLIVYGVLSATVFFGYRPDMKKFLKVMGITLLMAIVVYFINIAFKQLPPYEVGNYMSISYPPTGGSPIDLLAKIFGPAPYYMIGLTILAGIIYIALYCIVTVFDKISNMIKGNQVVSDNETANGIQQGN